MDNTQMNFLAEIREKIKYVMEGNDDAGTQVTCSKCGAVSDSESWRNALCICPSCGSYQPMGGRLRLQKLFDNGKFKELDRSLSGGDPLSFPGYLDKLEKQKKKTGLREAVVSGVGMIGGIRAVSVVLDSQFFMGSMGTGVGEKVTKAIEYAEQKKLPLIIFSASGGARMQEGIFSLMQMAKTSAAIARFGENGGLFISFLTHPTTGGVTASFASLGDIMLAEPGALIGFAGPRVIEQTIGEKLPEGFQRSEFQKTQGFVDAIVPREEMRTTLIRILKLHQTKRA